MVNTFKIHATYEDETNIFKCTTRREFWTKVSRHFGLEKAELQLYEVDEDSRKKITINDLKDNMKVEIRKKNALNNHRVSEQRSDVEGAVKVPDQNDLLQKLQENRVLTGLERKFLIKVTKDYFDDDVTSNHKRKRDDDVQTSNKKTQVSTDHLKQTTYTQTDKVKNIVDQSKPSTSNEDLIEKGKRLAREEKRNVAEAKKNMTESFDQRRHFIAVQNPVVSLVKIKYPLLFELAEVRNELNRIFYNDKDKEFLENIEKYSGTILSLIDEDDALLKIVKKGISSAITQTQKKYAQDVGALLIISNILQEKRLFLHTEDEPLPPSNFPYIEASCTISKLFFDIQMYKIIVEGILLCEATNFKEAILCLIASFFIFNIKYPTKMFNTFVVMEKIFLEASDTDGNEIGEETIQIIKLIKLKTNANV